MAKFTLLSLIGACARMALARDYEVYFLNSGSIDYQMASHSISSRRRSTWNSITNKYDHLQVKANVNSAHSPPVNYFLQGLGPANVMGSNVHSARFPSGMSFAAKGDLAMNVGGVMVYCEDIRIGKKTKWWLGGSHCRGGNKGKNPLTCTCRDGALVKFRSKSTNSHNKFKVSLESKCGLTAARTGMWSQVTALPGQVITRTYTASESTYTEEDFRYSLTAQYSQEFSFGEIGMTAEQEMAFITQTTTSSTTTETCEMTVPAGQRLWQWTYTVTNDCGTSKLATCYFIALGINEGNPCCLAGYQSDVHDVCTEPGKNMCDGTRRLSPLLV